MTLASVGSYDSGYYDSLTSPFTVKRVYVNSDTPYDDSEYVQESFSRGDFGGINSTTSTKLMIKSHNVGVLNTKSRSTANIVREMISDGYSAKNAVETRNAINAYGLNTLNSNGIYNLSANVYEI